MHHRRNQCVSRLSCTKSQPIPSQFFRGTWCITDEINAFPGFLAPNLSLFRANSSGGLGASPTKSMRFRLSCTKSQPIPRQFFQGTWCIADAINAFHGFLAPSFSRFRTNSSGGLGASPTQSMRFQVSLHQVSAASAAKSKNLHPESNPILKI